MRFCLNAGTIGSYPFGSVPLLPQLAATKQAGFGLIGLDARAIDREYADLALLRRQLDDAGLARAEPQVPGRFGLAD